jgi:hypothetical protein
LKSLRNKNLGVQNQLSALGSPSGLSPPLVGRATFEGMAFNPEVAAQHHLGQVDDSHASVLRKSLAALSNTVELGEDLNYGLLVALAFVEEPFNESGSNTTTSKTTTDSALGELKKPNT